MASHTQASAFALEAGVHPISFRTFVVRMVLAGLANAAIAAFLLFRLPASREPSLHSLFLRALMFVGGAVLAGMAGSRFYWSRSSSPFTTDLRLSFRRFALANAEAWVWIPAVVLLSREDSPLCAVLTALGAALLANGLRGALPRTTDLQNRQLPAFEFEEREMFAATLQTPSREAHGYLIAISLYLSGYLLIEHFALIAGIPLALCAFLIVWKLTLDPAPTTVSVSASTRAALRLASIAAAAVLVTLFVLMIGIGHRIRVEAGRASRARSSGDLAGRNPRKSADSGISGYESIILWPAPEKKQIVALLAANISPLATRTTKPLVIRFDGAYWYFQPPDKRPGPNAHEARGSPLAVDIGANNDFPLTMEAVQGLSAAIRTASYREIQLSIANRDNIRGPIVLHIQLTDTTAPGKPSLSLGGQPVLSSEPGRFSFKAATTEEVLRFPVPERITIRKFDEITVFFLPDAAYFEIGPKIAIQQFVFVPR